VLEFQLNTRERTVFASFRLKGELEAIQFWIHQYQLVANKKGQTFIVVDGKDIETSHLFQRTSVGLCHYDNAWRSDLLPARFPRFKASIGR
jgi:hypothetical protein